MSYNFEATQRMNVDPEAVQDFAEARKGFVDFSYLRDHPAPNNAISLVEQELIRSCADHCVPYGIRKTPGGEVSYGNWYQQKQSEVIPSEGMDPVVIDYYNNDWSSDLPTHITISQGKTNTEARMTNSYFMCDARLMTFPAATAQLQRPGWGSHITNYIDKHKASEELFPNPDTSSVVLGLDVRTVLPDGRRGLLRGGFVQELVFRYFNTATHIKGTENKFQYILSILSGQGNMSDLYRKFQDTKKRLQKESPSLDSTDTLIEAAKKLRPFEAWGFRGINVFEIPPDVSPLVLISARRTTTPLTTENKF